MDKCRNCGQDLEKNDKFCRSCGQAVELDEFIDEKIDKEEEVEVEAREDTVVPSFGQDQEDKTLDISLVERARREQIRRELEDYRRKQEAQDQARDYKDYELEKTQVIGDINQYIDEEAIDLGQTASKSQEDLYQGGLPPKRPKKLDPKILLGLGLGLLIILGLLIYLFFGGKNNLSKEELIDSYIQALNNRNESELVGLLQSPTSSMKIDRDGIQAYFRYIDENPSYMDKLKFELEEQSKFYDKKKGQDIGQRFENVLLRYKDGNYYLEIKPYYVNIRVPSADVKLYLGDKLIGTSNSSNFEKEFGPYMPGIYDLKGELSTDGGQDQVLEKITLFEDNPNVEKTVINVELDLKLVSFKLSSNNDQAFLVVNGAKTNTRVRDLPGGIFGPVSGSTRLQLVLDTPFGELRSKELVASQVKDQLKLDIDFSGDLILDSLSKSINTFIREDAQALASLDTSVYTNIGEPELAKKTAQIEEMIDLNQSIESRLEKNIYDLNSLKLEERDGIYYGSIVVKTELEQSYLADFSVEKSNDPKYGNYQAQYDNNRKLWIINNVENASNFNLANTKEYRY